VLVWGIRVRAPREKVNILQHRSNDPHTNKKVDRLRELLEQKSSLKVKR